MKKINLKGLNLSELENLVISLGEKRYRGKQLFDWIYNKKVNSIEEMTSLSKRFREELSKSAEIGALKILSHHQSSVDTTTKFLFELHDGKKIESVLIPPRTAFVNGKANTEEQKRLTVCVSTQVGCPLNCVFCATGTMGFKRNLTVGEIIDQVLQIEKFAAKKITNIVLMGMGEPLLNYSNVVNSIKIFIDGMNIAAKRITLSTAGIVDGILRLADEGLKIKLAISLHSLDDVIRTKLMPLNKKYNLDKLIDAVKKYYQHTKMRVTFEYILFDGINDSERDIDALVKLSRTIPSKINLIPFHRIEFVQHSEITNKLKTVSEEKTEYFAQMLRKNNLTVFIRSNAGEDIMAACGQLAVKSGK